MPKLQKIIVERGQAQEIARIFNVTDQTVRNALRFITEGEMPDRIRKYALTHGGFRKTRDIKI